MIITNTNDVSLALAVWLLHDEYDYGTEPNYISATTLLKPLRQIILSRRIPLAERSLDVTDLIPSALGKSLHDSIEKAWVKGHRNSLKMLGYPDNIIDRILINPTPEQLKASPNAIPIYIEQRGIRRFKGYTIGGKFDMVTEGIVQDNKSTSVYSQIFGSRDEDYKLQGSIYKWIFPEIIVEDFMRVNMIFTDWQKAKAKQDPTYPQSRLAHKDIVLLTPQETENFISKKLDLITRFKDAPESEIPECTDEELWRSDPKYKYYSDPNKTDGRSTKNFDDAVEARKFLMNEKGGKGIIITVPGEVKRCEYCDAFQICKQKDKYFHD